jgi:hypothetical protein
VIKVVSSSSSSNSSSSNSSSSSDSDDEKPLVQLKKKPALKPIVKQVLVRRSINFLTELRKPRNLNPPKRKLH